MIIYLKFSVGSDSSKQPSGPRNFPFSRRISHLVDWPPETDFSILFETSPGNSHFFCFLWRSSLFGGSRNAGLFGFIFFQAVYLFFRTLFQCATSCQVDANISNFWFFQGLLGGLRIFGNWHLRQRHFSLHFCLLWGCSWSSWALWWGAGLWGVHNWVHWCWSSSSSSDRPYRPSDTAWDWVSSSFFDKNIKCHYIRYSW